MRILVYSDSPSAPTGFGSVVRNLFGSLVERGFCSADDVSFFGINTGGEPHTLPFKIWPAQIAASNDRDLYGRQRFTQWLLAGFAGMAPPQFDILFTLLDHFSLYHPVSINNQFVPFLPALVDVMQQQHKQGQRPPFAHVNYVPIDGDMLRPEWVTWMTLSDATVAYTEFGKRVLLDVCPALHAKLSVIPHGTNPETFFPIPDAERTAFRQQLGLTLGQPLVINVNRNQPRKDVPRTLQVFAKVVQTLQGERTPADKLPKLYLHMNRQDSAGFNLEAVAQSLRIPSHCLLWPDNFSEGVGVPLDMLNRIYNAADMLLTTARGEGWGLTISEAMCAGTLCIAPDHTSFHEILGSGRGVLVKPLPVRQVMTMDNDVMRPVADVDAMANKVLWAIKNPTHAKGMARHGMEWARALGWKDTVAPQWEQVFRGVDPTRARPAAPARNAYQLNVGAGA